jgi:hypothetical protein
VCRRELNENDLHILIPKLDTNESSISNWIDNNQTTTSPIKISEKMRQMQRKMRKIYEIQKKNGGIIDLNLKPDIIRLNVSVTSSFSYKYMKIIIF